MFRRRVPLSFTGKVKEILWPRKGFSRLYSYLVQRVSADAGVSLFVGQWIRLRCCGFLHPFNWVSSVACLWSCLFYAWQYGHSIAGTIFGNPWTFPLIFVLLQAIGEGLIRYFGLFSLDNT